MHGGTNLAVLNQCACVIGLCSYVYTQCVFIGD